MGLRDQLLFPEIDYMKVDKARGMNVSVVTTARTDAEARKLLQLMGMPFRAN
jgi:large subunit ribosomal protein L5